MDKLEIYLTIIPLPFVIMAGFLLMMVYLIIPAETRFYITFLVMPSWLTLAKCPDLGFIHALTKISSGLLFVLIALAAILRPVPKRRVPVVAWLYVVASIWYFVAVLGTTDRVDSMVVEVQWVALVLAAIATISALTSLEDVHKLFWTVGVGIIIALAIPVSAIVISPKTAFLAGLNRLSPWGVPPNLIGLLFLIGAPVILYMAMSTKKQTLKPPLFGLLILCIGLTLLTGSRMAAFSMILSLGLISLPLVKRPGLLLVGGAVSALILPLVLSVNEDAVERLGSLDSSGRIGLWWEYFKLSLQRPLGLFGVSGESTIADSTIFNHPHSCWIEMLYLGGYPYLLMLITPAIISLRSAWTIWKNKYIYGDRDQQFLVHVMCAMIVSFYFQSFFNQSLYHPTFTLSFFGVMLTVLIIAMRSEVPAQRMLYEEWLDEAEWDDEEEDEEDWEDVAVPAPT